MKGKLFLGIAALFFISVLATGCESKMDIETETNVLGGRGTLEYRERLNGHDGLRDDNNVYIKMGNLYYKLDENKELSINCDIASCPHSDETCNAYLNGQYFVFHDKVYKYNNVTAIKDGVTVAEGFIYDCETGEVVFDNPVPETLSEDLKTDDSTEIFYIRVLEEGILKVEAHRHAYLLDKNFNVIYWHEGIGDFPWGMVYENKYYYVNVLCQMICVDLETGESSIMKLEDKVDVGEGEQGYLFYSTSMKELYKYSIKEGTSVKIADNVVFYNVYDEYIYCWNSDKNSDMEKYIMDIDGNFIADITEYKYLEPDVLLKIGDKIYQEIVNYETMQTGLAEMEVNGTNYKEYFLE